MTVANIDKYVTNRDALDGLARAYAESKTGRGLLFFVGSGPSTEAGLPDWRTLRSKLTKHADYLVKKNAISDDLKGKDLRALSTEEDYWRAFSLLKGILGPATYADRMREYLTPNANVSLPQIYRRIAEFDIRGIITTNIDDLLLKAMAETSRETVLKPVYGKDINDRLEILLRERPFFFQMHGNISAERTWVFTSEELDAIRKSNAHQRFLSAVFFTSTVVFIGISADDISVTGRLVELTDSGLVTTPHYWITPDIHNRKRDWAEANGIRQIVYPSKEGHADCLGAILDYIKSFRPAEVSIDRVSIDRRGALVTERDPAKLAGLDDIDQIRQSLNGIVLENADRDGRIQYEQYAELCRKYRRAIASAYLLPAEDGEKWFGHVVDRTPLGGRTFGSVYSAMSPSGELTAIKILQQRRFQDTAYLSAFRRGAEALKILERYQMSGVARLRESYELPPTLIMEFENGATLDQVVPNGRLTADAVLKVFRRCASIVKAAHGLPQTVMHRDIKPSNIMLRNFDWGTGQYDEVVMFDFDLGWYKGAYGDEVSRTDPESLGFQAPEQLQQSHDGSRRSTLVDSFGLAITLYYCLSGVSPSVGASEADDWSRRIEGACGRAFPGDTVAAKRVARMIVSCTRREQRKRPDSSLIVDALDDLVHWRLGVHDKCSTEFLAEAIASLASEGTYEWDDHRQIAYCTFASGMSIKTTFDPLENRLILEFRSEDTTDVNRRNANQRLADLPDFISKEAEKCSAVEKKWSFTGTRQIEGAIKWETASARNRVKEIGAFARSIGRWMSAL